jgi:naphthoate synthase
MNLKDIIYQKKDRVAKILLNRPEVYNAFRTQTLRELAYAFEDAELDESVGVVVLTGAGKKAFSTGGDSKEVSGEAGYKKEMDYWHSRVHQAIRTVPKPVIAAVNGYAIGGGHILHILCDLTIAAEHARFGQAGPRVGSFDAGYGAAYLARIVGEKKAREIWFLCRQYSAQEALDMGLVNKVVPGEMLEEEVNRWSQEILGLSPTALKFLKAALNADSDNIFGLEQLSAGAVRLYWETPEAFEGRQAYLEKRKPNWDRFRK